MKVKSYRPIISKLIIVSSLGIGWFLMAIQAQAAAFPDPSQEVFVYDETNNLSQGTKNYIIGINKEYEQTPEKPQLAVALVNSLGELTVDEYAVGLFNKWQIGDSELSNGVLLLLAPTEGKVRIEVGYGLEDVLTDALTGWILDDSLEALKAKEYDRGVDQIVTEMALKINGEIALESQIVTREPRDYDQLLANQAEKTPVEEEVAKGNSKLGISSLVIRLVGLLIFIWLSRHVGSSGGGSSSSGGGFGGFGGGSSGGSSSGGSSFGGGSSGGGGSSRSF